MLLAEAPVGGFECQGSTQVLYDAEPDSIQSSAKLIKIVLLLGSYLKSSPLHAPRRVYRSLAEDVYFTIVVSLDQLIRTG